jgi:sulfate permease, SulP family
MTRFDVKSLFNPDTLRGDIMGGITAGVIALPLALAFGEASGAGPVAGLYGAIIVGFFAALFGGTGSQISGPTGPMVVVFAGVLASLSGDLGLIFLAVILAGLFQILMGVLKLGQYIRLVPYPVISGFMSGIGCIIIALQLPRIFGFTPEGSGTLGALASLPDAVSNLNTMALIVGIISLLIVFSWPKKWGKYVPGALVALVGGTFVSVAFPGSPILGDIPQGLPELTIPSFELDALTIVIEAAILLALLGAIDSLLTSLVADNMTRTRHSSDKELIGQGIGNTVAGLFGGIPGAGATMRTVVNIRSGGSTRLSGMIHAVFLLLIAVSLAPLASQIPHAALAGILVKVGYDIVDVNYLKKLHKSPRWDLALMLIVLLLTVFADLILAVGVGVVLAALGYVKQTADIQLNHVSPRPTAETAKIQCPVERDTNGKVSVVEFDGLLSFGAASDLAFAFREKWETGQHAVIINFAKVPHVDLSAIKAIEAIASDAQVSGKKLIISGSSKALKTMLHGFDIHTNIPDEHWFDNHLDAVDFVVGMHRTKVA